MLSIQELRHKYPNPRRCSQNGVSSKSYCVGGALTIELGYGTRTPSKAELGNALVEANPNLRQNKADRFAMQIIQANDGEWFEEAWMLLEKALTHS